VLSIVTLDGATQSDRRSGWESGSRWCRSCLGGRGWL